MIRPLGDKIVVRPVKKETTTSSGLVIAHQDSTNHFKGVVVATGPGNRNEFGVRESLEVGVGHIVMFGKNAGQRVDHNGEQLVVLTESEVLAIL